MTSLTQADQTDIQLLEDRFWQALRLTFSRVFLTDVEPVEEYRASLSSSSPYERLLALHDDPLDVAAVLLGVKLTPEITERYDAVMKTLISDADIQTLPFLGRAALEGPAQDVDAGSS